MNKFYLIILSVFLLSGCSQIAKEDLNGSYEGTVTYVLKYSQLNLGIPDKQVIRKCHARVFTSGVPSIVFLTYEGKSVKKSNGTNLNITGIKLLSDGVRFSIPHQEIKEDGTTYQIYGNASYEDTEGNKFDGFLDERNHLNYSYIGLARLNVKGIELNPTFELHFQLKKTPPASASL
ncbi:hypothetical protein [Pontibacter fetidus]|uniref:Lipoprotein n=1 Tax=Pontibacter fetidus TaxID=2700082 RepID=A0A6B2H4K0_9BACT|nr:hypothetical protein [Pontibacter fetidus]NDK54690.1 hypothetical protein [Pontibacter fetidus]